jgi:hypothetical protein
MKKRVAKTMNVGDLVVAAFDAAAHYSRDARQVSRLATQAVVDVLRHAQRTITPSRTADGATGS